MSSEPSAPHPADYSGKLIGSRYRLEGPIDSRRSGAVYRALDQQTNRRVVVKLVRGPISDRAKRAIGQLRTNDIQNVAGFVDFGFADGFNLLVSEYVDGESLDDFLSDNQPDPSQVNRFVLAVGRALQGLHDADVVHGCVKAGNVRVKSNDDGSLDFVLVETGIGPTVRESAGVAPEVQAGEEATVRSDVFGFGVVVSHLLDRLADAPPTWRSIVEKCMRPDPPDRPGSVREAVDWWTRTGFSPAHSGTLDPLMGGHTPPEPAVENSGMDSHGVPLVGWLRELSPPAIEALRGCSRVVDREPGDIILKQGERNRFLYFLLSGSVGVLDEGARVATIDRVGQMIGEVSVKTSRPCTASVNSNDHVRLLAIDMDQVSASDDSGLLEFRRRFDSEFSSSVAARLEAANRKLGSKQANPEPLHPGTSPGNDHNPLAARFDASNGATRMAGLVLAGRYEIRQPIAEGGFGKVYEAFDNRLGKRVAIKVARDITSDADFSREARKAAQIEHPNVVRTTDSGVDRELPFLVMEYLEGPTLDELLQRGKHFSERIQVQLVRDLCRALQAVHSQQLIHRDLKPKNIKYVQTNELDDQGHKLHRFVLMDFGIARRLDWDATRGSQVGGTPEYMAPEQWDGVPPTPRTDLYALGVILYQMLTGRVPFERPDDSARSLTSLYRAHVTQLPCSFSEIGASRSAARVEPLVRSCLEKDPANRPQSALELWRQWKDVLQISDVNEAQATGTSTGDAAPIEAGTVLNRRWKLMRVLDEKGAFGEVWEGQDLQFSDRKVALKLSRNSTVDAGFESEAQRLADLERHPNVVTVYGYGVDHGASFIAMQFLDGPTLKEEIDNRGGKVDWEMIDQFVNQVGGALEASHAKGLIHRDLKPANIKLLSTGEADHREFVLIDFGIAKNTNVVDGETRAGFGTPEYMSPEQVASAESTNRTDVYSFGVMLYELVTGRPPFPLPPNPAMKDLAVVLEGHSEKAPPPFANVRPQGGDVDIGQLQSLVLKCLEKQPHNRPASIAEVRDAWKQLYQPQAPPESKWSTLATIGSVVAVLIAVGAFILNRPTVPPPTLSMAADPLNLIAGESQELVLTVKNLVSGDVQIESELTDGLRLTLNSQQVGSLFTFEIKDAVELVSPLPLVVVSDLADKGWEGHIKLVATFPDGTTSIAQRPVQVAAPTFWCPDRFEPAGPPVQQKNSQVALYRRIRFAPWGDENGIYFVLIPSQTRCNESEAAFYIMENKVTAAQFARFVDENEIDIPESQDRAWRKQEFGGKVPAFGVSYTEAVAFAEWVGGSLPRIEEWIDATGFGYWKKNAVPEGWSHEGPFKGPDLVVNRERPADAGSCPHDISPVGYADPNRPDEWISCRDLAGNGLEWTTDRDGSYQPVAGSSWTTDRIQAITFQFIEEAEKARKATEAGATQHWKRVLKKKTADDISFRVIIRVPPNL